ncbi:hypothetical protein Osc2_16640 [Ruminococcus sp. 25CYCFAH16]
MADRNIKTEINIEFSEAPSRQSLNSGDEIKSLFGKLKKWLSDLKAVAFSGSYKDLIDKPSIPSVDSSLSSTSTNPVQNKAVKAALDDKSNTDHTHDYLSLSGGTMNPDSEIVIPYGTTGRAAGLGKNGVRVYTTSNGSAWASGVSFYKTDKETSLGAIGAYGRTDTLEYYYIGSYQNPVVKITPDGKITTAAGGNLLYSGSISTAGESVTIQGLADYSIVLLQTYGVGANGLSCGITTLIPIAYISKGNSIRLYGGIPSSSYITSSGPQAAKDMGGYITASMTSDSPSILTLEQSVGIIGNIQIYSII